MKLKNHGLTLVLLILFAVSITGQIFSGFKTYNDERIRDRLPPMTTIGEYLTSGHFISSTSENMESEFLQMAFFAYLTCCLYQRGSGESNKLPEEKTPEDVKEDKEEEHYSHWKRQRHPILWRLYENSLTLGMLFFFTLSFIMHMRGSWMMVNEEHAVAGKPPIAFLEVLGEQEFWFESFQNWQSEFFSIAVMVVFTIFLRQKGSAQSKKMNDPFWKTGSA